MTTRTHHRASQTAVGTAGLILSLSHTLPNPSSALARSASALAHRLSNGTSTRADHDAAAAMLARLLDETDTGLAGYDEDGLLDGEFDA
jgi:hypothetical protein